MNKRANNFFRHGSNFTEPTPAVVAPPIANVPLKLKPGTAYKFLRLERFRNLSIVDCITHAKLLTKNRVECHDKATAIALILGATGKLS